jgi:CRISPR-associated endonuclease Cas1
MNSTPCAVCGRPTRPGQQYCSFRCAGKAGVGIQDILRAAKTPPPTPTPTPPVPAPTPPADEAAIIPYHGDLYQDATAYQRSAERNTRIATSLLKNTDMMVLAGYGAGITVVHDALVVRDGRSHGGQQVITRTLHRGLHGVSKIVFCNVHGGITLPAIEWCHQQGITLVMLDHYGQTQTTITSGHTTDARLRRCQYLAAERGSDVTIAAAILKRKFASQLRTIEAHATLPGAARALENLKTAIAWFGMEELPPWLSTIAGLRVYEARIAALYFNCFRGLPIQWARPDRRKVPPHWLEWGPRFSPVSNSHNARQAIDPGNSILNYAYGCLEASCRQALALNGFDTACGFLHADLKGRDSLVYDLMELERGTIDGFVLNFLLNRVLHYGDITRVNDGSIKLHPELAKLVVASCKLDQGIINSNAVWLRDFVVASSERQGQGQ